MIYTWLCFITFHTGGADVNYINKSRYTLLVSSLSSSTGSEVGKVKYLLARKADPNIKTPRGTALQQVLEWKGCIPALRQEMVKILLEAKAEVCL